MIHKGAHMLKRLSVLILLSGCSTYVSDVAPEKMRGMNVADLIACAGIPDQKMKTKPDVAVLEWVPKSTSGSGSKTDGWSYTLPLGASVTWSMPTDTCHMQATILQDGTVADVDMSSSNSVKGADGACAQIIKQCVYNQSDTGLPKGYDAWEYLFPTDTTTKSKTP
jgi:hypothetical protein